MIKSSFEPNQGGFTLIEIMAVLVILGVLVSVAVKKYGDIANAAEDRALLSGITELNSRETLTWTNQKFAPGGYTNDGDIWTAMNTDLGTSYSWAAAPNAGGGTLRLGGRTIILNRTASSTVMAGRWAPP
ncbi:MAG: prepilin-type N-terminal cleavage/methylation domain-containing protein [Deltaproteobacteria bacterium]|nr:MAG: prepilin-type N-terminal cleavage/methylation domain-containing protein [Deltaproteobacteria bacterium]